MTTKLPENLSDKWKVTDGWVFPDYSGKEFQQDPMQSIRGFNEMLAPINSFEFQQGIFGQYRHFYGIKQRNNYSKHCFKNCITAQNLKTSNLTQEDKLCARECIISQERFQNATNIYIEKVHSDAANFEELVPLDNLKYFSS